MKRGLNTSFKFTSEEQKTLDLMNQGLRPKKIAEKLGISLGTVYGRINTIRQKASLNAARKTIEQGISQ